MFVTVPAFDKTLAKFLDQQLARAPKRCKTFCFYWTLGGDDGKTVEGFLQAYPSTKAVSGSLLVEDPCWESLDPEWEPPEDDERAVDPGTILGPRGAFGDAAFAATMTRLIEAGFQHSEQVARHVAAGDRFVYTVHGEGVGEYRPKATPRGKASSKPEATTPKAKPARSKATKPKLAAKRRTKPAKR